jgi:4-amino-4-deoxy-L-arabinose transferase-like glycosyltransferase
MPFALAPLRVAAKRAVGRRLLVSLSPLLLVFLFLFRLGHRELTSSHEARAAQNAQRMLDTGEWGLPVLFDGQTDLQKPPGYYWLVAGCGWINGGAVDAFAARFPAALAGLATVLMVYLFLRRAGQPTAAVVAAVGLATAIHFTAISRTARIDVPLTCTVTAALFAFRRGCEDGGRRWHLLSAVAAAAGVMLKGPIALALIGPVAVAWLACERLLASGGQPRSQGSGIRSQTEASSGLPDSCPLTPDPCEGPPLAEDRPVLPLSSVVLGTLVVVALAGPWFLWANRVTDGEFVHVFFWHHNVARFTGSSPTLASYPWWYYVPRFAVDFLPWTPALVLLGIGAFRSGRWREDPLFRFGLVWFAVMFVVLSTARFKRSDYLLPLFPGAAIAMGCAAEGWLASRTDPRTIRRTRWAFGVVVALVAVGWQVVTFAVEPAEQAKEEKRAFAAAIREHAPPPNEVVLFRAESHLLALRLGRPLVTMVEWKDLNDRLAEPGPHFVVMPPEYVYPAQQIVTSQRLVVVARLDDYVSDRPPRPLVFLRTAD